MTRSAMCRACIVLLLAVTLLDHVRIVEPVPLSSRSLGKPYLRTLRLCSRSLSDALYIVCRERGYNEPFSYSGEEEPRVDNGQGLVEECCYHSCSYEQLEQYCKPIPEEKRGDTGDVIEESYRIVNLPYPSATRDLSEEGPRSVTDYAGDATKRFTRRR